MVISHVHEFPPMEMSGGAQQNLLRESIVDYLRARTVLAAAEEIGADISNAEMLLEERRAVMMKNAEKLYPDAHEREQVMRRAVYQQERRMVQLDPRNVSLAV